ncbi:4-hydroxyphenylpyruvate dioxygenase [Aetokthonos hydrillicola Thurmond2011]|jgi:4-hydroxyphenylpyruvate dioxygenase|uniref:4-hydroxyphenylpyruvate dioxygenase n=1 Tax=Aetokthonos hydrillicola Thurmond2011 TaxID=2712845 RepID=A0AAP5MBJ3_9CYAN|nr:4-hydroxyphenylpyruvate dioxygenase [Aetokthonos hydrillicola]MBO3458004.1 4-hydroxyphenylpyruvate dioxygenase [Aetokthonos hydrillicola CCALA 1050]MBW4587162.1 4-hydroxyphenylpyruvate dioxygenase [Aetokthonos hydrillicola CCALA 1050]MDR9899330.1 4-hydroxyphenylpyruvate dioxygenase [Aetokthonos hydrillicola Thurmond2011]
MNDFCPIKCFDHLEFYVGNAKQAALFYSKLFGFTNIAYRGLETGSRQVTSYVMRQGNICFVLSTALNPDHCISQSVLKHGDGVGVIALEVPDAVIAYKETTKRGAVGAIPPTEEEEGSGVLRYSAIHGYGDTLIKFVDRSDYFGVFAPSFEPLHHADTSKFVRLHTIDHVVGNVELGAMEKWVQFFANTMGFKLLVHFDKQAISTEYSALMSKVMQDGTGKIKLPINEPAEARRKSQIEEYLEYNNGPGVQHIACATNNIIDTVVQMRAAGVKFLHVPKTYYDNLEQRVGKIDAPIERLAELGILVDRDEDGYLLQIFTELLQDRPTLFLEVIERHGAQSFGEGNFKSLFEAIEREQALRGNL